MKKLNVCPAGMEKEDWETVKRVWKLEEKMVKYASAKGYAVIDVYCTIVDLMLFYLADLTEEQRRKMLQWVIKKSKEMD